MDLSEMLKTGLLVLTKKLRQVACEQCESLHDEMAYQLTEVMAEIVELRVAVERQVTQQQEIEPSLGAEGLPMSSLSWRHDHRDAVSELGEVRPWKGATYRQQIGVAAPPSFPTPT